MTLILLCKKRSSVWEARGWASGQLGAADVVCVKGRVQACLCKSPPRSSFHVLCMLACWNIGTHKEKCCDYFIPPNVCSVMLLTSDWSRNMLQSANKCKTFHLCFLIFHAFSKMTLLFMYFILNLLNSFPTDTWKLSCFKPLSRQ